LCAKGLSPSLRRRHSALSSNQSERNAGAGWAIHGVRARMRAAFAQTGLPRAHASRDGLQRGQTQALGQSTSSFTRQVTPGPRSRLQPRPPLTPVRYPTAKTYRLADDQIFSIARWLLIGCSVEAQSADFGAANDGKRLLTNPSSDQNLPVQFCKASSQTKCVIRIHYDIVFGVYAPNSRRMDAGNPAFARLRNLIGKVNLLSSFQMSEEILASGRRKDL